MAELDVLIEAAAGGPFDVASPKEVREVLFERLQLPVPACAMKPGRKHPSTDQEARPSFHSCCSSCPLILVPTGITKPAIRRLACRGGVKRISASTASLIN